MGWGVGRCRRRSIWRRSTATLRLHAAVPPLPCLPRNVFRVRLSLCPSVPPSASFSLVCLGAPLLTSIILYFSSELSPPLLYISHPLSAYILLYLLCMRVHLLFYLMFSSQIEQEIHVSPHPGATPCQCPTRLAAFKLETCAMVIISRSHASDATFKDAHASVPRPSAGVRAGSVRRRTGSGAPRAGGNTSPRGERVVRPPRGPILRRDRPRHHSLLRGEADGPWRRRGGGPSMEHALGGRIRRERTVRARRRR